MSNVTSVQLQRSASLRPTTMGPAQKSAISQVGPLDLSLISSEAVVASSQTHGWQNLHAVELRHKTSEWAIPPFDNHCVIVQLGPLAAVSARVGDYRFEQTLEPGEIVIVPADLPLYWQQRDTAENHTLHLYLHPNFLRTTAEDIDLDYSQISIALDVLVSNSKLRKRAARSLSRLTAWRRKA